MPSLDWPRLGYGVRLRAEHYEHVLDERPAVDWFEALTENYLDTGGRPLHVLEQVRRDHPVVLHGVALSIGGTDPLDRAYLASLRGLIDRIAPALVTDHLCWTGVDGRSLHDLLPLPYTEATLHHVATRVRRVQDALGRRIALENPSTYVAFRHSTMAEWEFLAALAEDALASARREQRPRERPQSRLRSADVPRRDLRRSRRLHAPRRLQRARRFSLRHPRRAGARGRLGALPARLHPARRALDPDRVGRQAPIVRAAARRGRARPPRGTP
jgi:hypothetical protein